jgi:putative protein kinase ArgK-like GTPase of G3E family
MDLVTEVLNGNRLALARLLTQVENGAPAGREALDGLFRHTGRAHLIGVTGAPGTGKSSLVNQLALAYRKSTDDTPPRVAIVAVDPSSPFTGGAILGDRIRMRELSGDPGVSKQTIAHIEQTGKIRPELWSAISDLLPIREQEKAEETPPDRHQMFVMEENMRIIKQCVVAMGKQIDRLESTLGKNKS